MQENRITQMAIPEISVAGLSFPDAFLSNHDFKYGINPLIMLKGMLLMIASEY